MSRGRWKGSGSLCIMHYWGDNTVQLRPTDLFTVGDLNILDYRALSSHNLYSLSQWHTYTHQRYTQRRLARQSLTVSHHRNILLPSGLT